MISASVRTAREMLRGRPRNVGASFGIIAQVREKCHFYTKNRQIIDIMSIICLPLYSLLPVSEPEPALKCVFRRHWIRSVMAGNPSMLSV